MAISVSLAVNLTRRSEIIEYEFRAEMIYYFSTKKSLRTVVSYTSKICLTMRIPRTIETISTR